MRPARVCRRRQVTSAFTLPFPSLMLFICIIIYIKSAVRKLNANVGVITVKQMPSEKNDFLLALWVDAGATITGGPAQVTRQTSWWNTVHCCCWWVWWWCGGGGAG